MENFFLTLQLVGMVGEKKDGGIQKRDNKIEIIKRI